jgi:outer membrane immunogenic protein
MTKHFLSGLLIATLLAAPAGAADLPVKAPPLPAAIATWNGFYVGANIGGGWQKADTSLSPTNGALAATFNLAFANGVLPVASSPDSSGVLGGITLGYNLQRGAFVFGLEGDFMGTHLNATSTTTNPNVVPFNTQLITISTTTSTDWLATVRGRIGGVLIADTLLYATGGLAVGQVNGSTSITPGGTVLGVPVSCATAAFCSAGSASNTQVGWTAGIGAERMFAQRLSAKIEYLHYDLGTLSYTVNEASPGFPAVAGIANVNISTRITGDIVRAGLNWRF